MNNIYRSVTLVLMTLGVMLVGHCPLSAQAWERQHPSLPIECPADVWAFDSYNVFAAGSGGLIYKFDGYAWDVVHRREGAVFNAVWGLGPEDVFVAGAGGLVLYFNGIDWNELETVSGDDLNGIWGDTPANLYAAGDSGVVYHYDGNHWNKTEADTGQALNGILGFPDGDVFVVGEAGTAYRLSGGRWRSISTGSKVNLRSVWGSCATDVYAVGDDGAIFHYDGVVWEQYNSFTDTDFFDVFGYDGRILAVGESGVVRVNEGGDWRKVDGFTSEGLTGVHAAISGDFFLSGSKGNLYRFDGTGAAALNGPLPPRLTAVWGEADRVWAVGIDGAILRYDGLKWTEFPSPTNNDLYAIHGTSETGIWAVGSNGTIIGFDGNAWFAVDSPVEKELRGLWASSDGEAFAVGREGTILKFDGRSWEAVSSPTQADLYAVKGGPDGRLPAVGEKGTIVEFDGGTWNLVDVPSAADLHGLWSDGSGRFFACGSTGAVLYSDGFDWSVMSAPGEPDLHAIWGENIDDLYAAGRNGTILRFDGLSWAAVSSPTAQDLYGLWGGGEAGIFAVGEAGTILWRNAAAYSGRLTVTKTGRGTVRVEPGRTVSFENTRQAEFDYGTPVTLEFDPAAGFAVEDVLVDGASAGPVGRYSFPSLSADHTVEVDFGRQTWTITSSAGTGGAISPLGAVSVSHGADQLFQITPDSGFKVNNLLVDSVSQGAIYYYNFINVTADHTISATFTAGTTHTITPTEGSGGSIYPDWPVPVDDGGSQTFTMTPDTGYRILDVQVNGTSIGAQDSYTFANVTQDQTISATFERIAYAITASATSGGSISPTGTVAVFYGDDQSFTITATSGYHISDVQVNGVSVGAVSTYNFQNVIQNHTIHAIFEPDTYTITASAGQGGTISPAGSVQVTYLTDQTFTITPSTGYDISDVVVDGSSVGAVSTYTFQSVSANHTITASFVIKTYTITASAGTGGAISPSGSVQVTHGQSQTFTITTDTEYDIADLQVDGVSVGILSSYTFSSVDSDHTISVTFAVKTYTIVSSSTLGGTISPSGNISVTHAADQAFTITSDADKSISQVLVDNVSIGTIPSDPYTYTFTSVTASHTIHVVFSGQSTVTAVATVDKPSPSSGATVTLDGSGSTPSTGLTYTWTQSAGSPTVTFYDSTAVSTTFVAPVVTTATQLTFTLTVSDGQNSDSADVSVTVHPTTITVSGAPDDAYLLTSTEGTSVGIKITDGSSSALTVLRTYNPSNISDTTNRPETLPYGLFEMSANLASGQTTLAITFYLPSAASDDAGWYKYTAGTGWTDYTSNVTFSTDRTQVTISYTDNGAGDDDSTTGRITDLSGLGEPSGGNGGSVPVTSHSAGGGCFIGTSW